MWKLSCLTVEGGYLWQCPTGIDRSTFCNVTLRNPKKWPTPISFSSPKDAERKPLIPVIFPQTSVG